MNQTIRELMERKSVRVFTDEEITVEKKRAILLASTAAATAGNMQMYTILDITDPSLKETLADLCDHQPFIAEAKMVLVYVADYRKWYDAFIEAGASPRKPGVGDLMLAVTDTCIAAQNAVVAAESLGIGSCYIGDVMENHEKMREVLQLPKYTFPCAMLVFGYPTQQQKERVKPQRCPLEDIVSENTYVTKDSEMLRHTFASKHPNRSFEEWAKAFCERKYNSDFSVEMSRSVMEYIKEFEK